MLPRVVHEIVVQEQGGHGGLLLDTLGEPHPSPGVDPIGTMSTSGYADHSTIAATIRIKCAHMLT